MGSAVVNFNGGIVLFDENSATISGGAIHQHSTGGYIYFYEGDVTFLNNYSKTNGGAIYVSGRSIYNDTVGGVEFTADETGKGIVFDNNQEESISANVVGFGSSVDNLIIIFGSAPQVVFKNHISTPLLINASKEGPLHSIITLNMDTPPTFTNNSGGCKIFASLTNITNIIRFYSKGVLVNEFVEKKEECLY